MNRLLLAATIVLAGVEFVTGIELCPVVMWLYSWVSVTAMAPGAVESVWVSNPSPSEPDNPHTCRLGAQPPTDFQRSGCLREDRLTMTTISRRLTVDEAIEHLQNKIASVKSRAASARSMLRGRSYSASIDACRELVAQYEEEIAELKLRRDEESRMADEGGHHRGE